MLRIPSLISISAFVSWCSLVRKLICSSTQKKNKTQKVYVAEVRQLVMPHVILVNLSQLFTYGVHPNQKCNTQSTCSIVHPRPATKHITPAKWQSHTIRLIKLCLFGRIKQISIVYFENMKNSVKVCNDVLSEKKKLHALLNSDALIDTFIY